MNKKENYNSIILNIGILLLICASFMYLVNIYNDLSNMFKIIALIVEMIVFFSISFVYKKINNKYGYNILYFLSTLFIPIILYLLNYYRFLPFYFKNEAGLFIYLSIISFISSIIYLITYIKNKNKFYLFLTILLSFTGIILLLSGLKLSFVNITEIVLSISLVLSLIFNYILKENKHINIYNISLSIILIILSFVLSFYIFINNTFIDELILLLLLFANISLLFDKCFIKHINPWIYTILLFCFTYNNFSLSICIYSSIILQIALYIFFEIKKYDLISFTLCFIVSYIVLNVLAFQNYDISIILNTILIIFSLFSLKLKNNLLLKMFEVIIALSTIIFSYNIFNKFNISSNIYLIVSSLLNYIYYLIFNKFKRENVFNIFYLLLLVMSLLMCTYNNDMLFIFSNLILWIIYFIINKVKLKKSEYNMFYVIGILISLLILAFNIKLSINYVCAFISLSFFVAYEYKKEVYLIIGSIVLFLNILNSLPFNNSYLIFIISLLYSYSYLKLRKLPEKYIIFKIFSTFFGFFLIYNILLYIIKPVEIVNIISFVLYWFILITMYLTEKEDNKMLLLYSLSLLYPYYNYVMGMNILSLYVLPFIVYLLVISKVFDMKNKKLIIIGIIFLSLLTIDTNIYNIIINFIIFLIYIIYGVKNDDKTFIYFSILYLAFILVRSLNNIFGSITLIISMLVLSILLIVYSLRKK